MPRTLHTTVIHVMEKNNVFLDVISPKPALHTHDRGKKMLEQSAVTYNTYDGTIKGKFHSDGATLWAALADFVLVKDDSSFSVCYSVMNVLTPLRTVVLPERALPSHNF